MSSFTVRIGKQSVTIDGRIFFALLDIPYVKTYVAYAKAASANSIPLHDLKALAEKADVPYPLFFAPFSHVEAQLKAKTDFLDSKLPDKLELALGSRGTLSVASIELLGRDLGRRQEFLKGRVLPGAPRNDYLGCVSKMVKLGASDEQAADAIRAELGIDLSALRKLSKKKVLDYLVGKAEDRSVLVSFSSYQYMPQKIDRSAQFSGFCVKDTKFPIVFINARDGDDQPLILESDGRQIFTLLAMLVLAAMGKFVLGINRKRKDQPTARAHMIVGEILIPKADLRGVNVSSLKELKDLSATFKVTPSMLLRRLRVLGKISPKIANELHAELARELKAMEPPHKTSPLPVNGFGKYNGTRFSREVIKAQREGRISVEDMNSALFRRRRVPAELRRQYVNLYS